jgi:hypothetical protein
LLGFVCKHWFCNWVLLWFVFAIDHLHPPQCGFCSVVVPKNKSPAIDHRESFLDSEFLSQQYPILISFSWLLANSSFSIANNTRIYHLQHDPENQKTEEKKRKKSQKHKKHEKKNQNQKSKEFLDQIWFLSSSVQWSLESCFDFWGWERKSWKLIAVGPNFEKENLENWWCEEEDPDRCCVLGA